MTSGLQGHPDHPDGINDHMTGDTFTAAAREQIRFIQARLLAVARWANGSGIDDNATEFLVQPNALDTIAIVSRLVASRTGLW